MDLGKDLMLDMYRSMQRIRQFEGRVRDLAIANELPGFVHVSIGEGKPGAAKSGWDWQSDRSAGRMRGR